MGKLSVITVPNPKLRQTSTAIDTNDPKTAQFITDLGELLLKRSDPPGVGLSAIQVGVPWRILALYLPNLTDPRPPKTAKGSRLLNFINPVITAHSASVTLGPDPKHPILEGCLSIPNVYGPVWRWDIIDVTHTVEGHPETVHLEGFAARVFQHEFDHLDGILFTDYVLGKSPIPLFTKLGDTQDLYFDNGHDLVKIADPTAFIQW